MVCDPLQEYTKTRIVEELRDSFGYGSGKYYYLSIGRTLSTGPAAQNNTVQNGVEFWRQCIGHKRIFENDVSYVIRRINWTAGIVYDQYRDDENLYDPDNTKDFYVLVDDKRVYKCLDNNSGTASTAKPIDTPTRPFQTADGYTWKYMYSIPESQTKFLTSDYMPVAFVQGIGAADPFEAQFTIQQAAVGGAIDFVEVLQAGDSYKNAIPAGAQNLNRIIGVSSASSFRIVGGSGGVSQVDGAYISYGLKIVETGKSYTGEIRQISAYDGDTARVTLSEPFSATPAAGDDIAIIPFVKITQADGTGATFEAKINSDKILTAVEVAERGQDYTFATLRVEPNPYSGTSDTEVGATSVVRAVISPPNGHGANPVQELGCRHIMISTEYDQTELGKITGDRDTASNDFYQFAIIVDPTVNNGANIAGEEGDMFQVYDVESDSSFVVNEFSGITASDNKLVIGNETGFRGTFQQFVPAIGNLFRGQVITKNNNGNFKVGEQLALADSDFDNSSVIDVTVSKLSREYNTSEAEVYRQSTRILVNDSNTSLTATTFPEDAVVKGLSSGATGIVSYWARTFTNSAFSNGQGTLELTGVIGTFQATESLAIVSSDGTVGSALGTATTVTEPLVDYYSGNVIYIQNLDQQLNRSDEQREEFRVVLGIA